MLSVRSLACCALKRVRRNVSQPIKKYVASKQKWRCSGCHTLLDHTYEVDHIIPLFKNGNNDVSNLQAMCPNCHAKKTFCDVYGSILE